MKIRQVKQQDLKVPPEGPAHPQSYFESSHLLWLKTDGAMLGRKWRHWTPCTNTLKVFFFCFVPSVSIKGLHRPTQSSPVGLPSVRRLVFLVFLFNFWFQNNSMWHVMWLAIFVLIINYPIVSILKSIEEVLTVCSFCHPAPLTISMNYIFNMWHLNRI